MIVDEPGLTAVLTEHCGLLHVWVESLLHTHDVYNTPLWITSKVSIGQEGMLSLVCRLTLCSSQSTCGGAISDRVRDVIVTTANDIAKRYEFQILDIDGEDDHIHLVVDYPPKLSLSKLVMVLKANTTKKIREQRFDEVESVLWGDRFWSPSYLVTSTGGDSLEKVRRYVQDQRKPPRGPGRPVDG